MLQKTDTIPLLFDKWCEDLNRTQTIVKSLFNY